MRWNTPASRRVVGALALLGAALIAGLTLVWVQEGRWRSPLYCISAPGTLWNGLAPLPPAFEPRCPPSQSYRREVRAGQSRVEQYRVAGWQPRAVADLLRSAGYVLIEDELRGADHYSAFLGRTVPAELHYTAVRDGDDTLITVSGP
ncbi:hypothetical protein [uncultured Deinococcus sp.]|uniref:hypothetical protein n=1 Tax=uncultured Deinococcus sp. TaxID=158789 RepID=UPI0025FF4F98|nr:hypothetical protein [uncultured Deinococcus sp.]